MSVTDYDSPEWSSVAANLLDERIRTGLRPTSGVAPDTDRMVRYLSNALSYAEARLVERSLTADAALRQRLRSLCAELDALQRATWAEVVVSAEAGDSVARAWRSLVVERAETAGSGSIQRSLPFWTTIQRGMAAGRVEAQTAWTAFIAFNEQVRLSLQAVNTQPALARGGADWMPVRSVGLPEDIEARLLGEAEVDGSLRVSLLLLDAEGQPFASVAGASATLELELEGEAWPLGVCTIESNRAVWTLPPLAAELPQRANGLPAGILRVLVGAAGAPLAPSTRRLFAEVLDAAGNVSSDRPIGITMEGSPRIESGLLCVTLSLPAAVREICNDYVLVLDAGIAPEHWQRLGVWPVAEWTSEPRTLSVPCPGPLNIETFVVPLRVRLQSSV